MTEKNSNEKSGTKVDRLLRMLSDAGQRVEEFDEICAEILVTTDFSKLSARILRKRLDDLMELTGLMFDNQQRESELFNQFADEPDGQGQIENIESLPELHQLVLETYTRIMSSAIIADTDDMESQLKYSVWISTFAAAGLAATIFRADVLISSFPVASLIAALSMLFGMIISAIIRHDVDEYRSLGLSQITDYDTQQIRVLLSETSPSLPINSLMDRIRFIGFHGTARRLEHRYSRHLRDRLEDRKLIRYQQLLVLLGFCILIEISFLREVFGV